ncbi:MAG: hypothetical protein ACFBSD_01845 [Paracoccaceae bacterium]
MIRPASILCAVALASPAIAQSFEPVCSGIGEKADAEAAATPHTLKLVYADSNGKYLADVTTQIARTGTVLVSQFCPGPWLLADLPPGTYEITAEFGGTLKSATVTVDGGVTERTITF